MALGKKTKFKIKLALELSMCLLTITSLAVTTYAWFSMQKTATITFWSMHVAENLTVNLKYCVHNQESVVGSDSTTSYIYPGYSDPRPPTTTDSSTRKTITSYATQFVSIANNQFVEGGPLDIKNLEPGTCHTFAFEITVPAGSGRTIELRLGGFSSPASTKNKVSVSPNPGITLASAIDMYADGFLKNTTDGDVNNTNNADQFIGTYMENGPVDKFVYYDGNETPRSDGYQLWNGTIAGGATEIVFFTIEFTDLDATFYSFASTDGTYDYYTRSTSGTSDCYRGLQFNVTNLYIQ